MGEYLILKLIDPILHNINYDFFEEILDMGCYCLKR